jgi:hypothetical protein
MIGNVMYTQRHPDEMRRVIGDFNLDTVGEYQSRLNSSLWVVRPPDTRAGFFADVAENSADFAIRNNKKLLGGSPDGPFLNSPAGTRNILNGDVVPFVGASDHQVFNDGAIAIPAVAYIHYPDPTWHTNADKIENVDATTLKRVAFMAATAALSAGWKDATGFDTLLDNSAYFGAVRLAHARSVAAPLARSKSAEERENASLIMRNAYGRERRTLQSLRKSLQFTAADGATLDTALARLASLEEQDGKGMLENAPRQCVSAAHTVLPEARPARTDWKAPLDTYRNVLQDKLGADALSGNAATPFLGSIAFYEATNLADGTHSLRDIYHEVAGECIEHNYPLPTPPAFIAYFGLLQRAGLITM